MCLAVPIKIIKIQGNRGIGQSGEVTLEIDLSLLEKVEINDYVLVHTGYAIQKIEEEEAVDTIHMLNELKDI